MVDYRIEELSAATGTTVRTLQSYRNRGLLPAPRREGRIGFYSDDHVARLRLIADLIGRGYSLNAVAELLDGLERGDRIGDLLGLGEALDQRDGPDSIIDHAGVAEVVGGDEVVAELVRLGIIEPVDTADESSGPDGRHSIRYRIVLSAAFDAGVELLAAGVPRLDLLRAARDVQRQTDELADIFVGLIVGSLIADGALNDTSQSSNVTELAERLVPFAEAVAADYLGAAITRRIKAEINHQLSSILTPEH